MIVPNNMMVYCCIRGAGKGNGDAGVWWYAASSGERKRGVVASPGCEQRRDELLRGQDRWRWTRDEEETIGAGAYMEAARGGDM